MNDRVDQIRDTLAEAGNGSKDFRHAAKLINLVEIIHVSLTRPPTPQV